MDAGRARVSNRGPHIVTGIGGGSHHPSTSSPSIHPYGRPWYSKKYFGSTSGHWAEDHPKRMPNDGCGFDGIRDDFRPSHKEFMQTYSSLNTAGGPHSMDPLPPHGKMNKRPASEFQLAEVERQALPGGFRARPGFSDAHLFPRSRMLQSSSAPELPGALADRKEDAFARGRREEPLAASEAVTSHLKLWYGDRKSLRQPVNDPKAGVNTMEFRRTYDTHTALRRIGQF